MLRATSILAAVEHARHVVFMDADASPDPRDDIGSLLDKLAVSDGARSVLDGVSRTTGMGFAAVARLTDSRWVACLACLPALIVSGSTDVEGIAPEFARLTKPFRADELRASLAALRS